MFILNFLHGHSPFNHVHAHVHSQYHVHVHAGHVYVHKSGQCEHQSMHVVQDLSMSVRRLPCCYEISLRDACHQESCEHEVCEREGHNHDSEANETIHPEAHNSDSEHEVRAREARSHNLQAKEACEQEVCACEVQPRTSSQGSA